MPSRITTESDRNGLGAEGGVIQVMAWCAALIAEPSIPVHVARPLLNVIRGG
jgi:hypothetical protein